MKFERSINRLGFLHVGHQTLCHHSWNILICKGHKHYQLLKQNTNRCCGVKIRHISHKVWCVTFKEKCVKFQLEWHILLDGVKSRTHLFRTRLAHFCTLPRSYPTHNFTVCMCVLVCQHWQIKLQNFIPLDSISVVRTLISHPSDAILLWRCGQPPGVSRHPS